ncbi:ATP-binding cassette domain-containing protein [Porphyromonas sp. COT-108 OH2963]|uniref:ATP-binding cassette domain-containing protein n=1 Tax=Porphyromonas sp. COT-108 OH2963 TaxID=1515614 RepID=UPI00068CE5EC|nr:ATP-binding cassette domain-containing protein [Porphyromonas sp. COT-108 OH2963]
MILPDRHNRTILLLALLLIVVVVAVPWIEMLLAVFVSILGVLLFVPVKGQSRSKRGLILVPLFILLGVLPVLIERVPPGSVADEVVWSRYGWGITSSGIDMFLLLLARCFAGYSVLLALLHLVPFYSMIQEMRRLKVPALAVELMEYVYRYIHILMETAQQIFTAQKLRGGYAVRSERSGHAALLLGQTVVLALHESDKMMDGLYSRSYGMSEPVQGGRQSGMTLRLQDLAIGYEKGKRVVEHLSLSVESGRKVVVMGRNGAGKSTLFKTLTGLLPPLSGAILLDGEEIPHGKRGQEVLRQKVAFVFQNSNHQLFTPSVRDEIAFGLINSGAGRRGDKRFESLLDEILEQYELTALAEKPPHLLSDGQRKWVAIVSVLVLDPSFVIFDEPTANLDHLYTQKVMALIDSLVAEGKGVLLSTHDADLAYAWGDEVWVINRGELAARLSPEELFLHPTLPEEAHLARPYALHGKVWKHPVFEPEPCERGYLPLMLRPDRLSALVIGGGEGAAIKVETLLRYGVATTVMAPAFSERLLRHRSDNALRLEQRAYRGEALDGFEIVIAATDDPSLNESVCRRAAIHSLLYMDLSRADFSPVQFPLSFEKEGLQLALRTKYKQPRVLQAFAKHFKATIPEEMEEDLNRLSSLRREDKAAYEVEIERFINALEAKK